MRGRSPRQETTGRLGGHLRAVLAVCRDGATRVPRPTEGADGRSRAAMTWTPEFEDRSSGVTPNQFRRFALGLPGTVEGSHGGHQDFRAGMRKRVFATIGYPSDAWAMVKLRPDQQALLVASHPEVFAPVKGAWGASGSTNVRLDVADIACVKNALRMAWEAVTPISKSKVTLRRREISTSRSNTRTHSSPALDWESVVAHALSLDSTELTTHYRSPAVKVNGRPVLSVGHEEGSFALHIDAETKQLLIDNDPRTYWQTKHYEGWPTLLVRYDTCDRKHVLAMVERAWQQALSLEPPRARKPSASTPGKRRKAPR
jgi:hypothetical protein